MRVVPLKIRKALRNDLTDLVLDREHRFAGQIYKPLCRPQLTGWIDGPIAERHANSVESRIAFQAFNGRRAADGEILPTYSELEVSGDKQCCNQVTKGVL